MLCRTVIRVASLCVALSAIVASAAPDDVPAQAQREAPLNEILREWERRSSERSSLDVRFTREDRDQKWHEKKNYAGRLVLFPKQLALVEMQETVSEGHFSSTERYVCSTDEFHIVRPEKKTHTIYSIAETDRGRLPSILALPFCRHLSVKDLESRYDIALLNYRPETWLLRFKPRAAAGRGWFSIAYLCLDKSTYLPQRFYLVDSDRQRTQDFRVTEVRSADPLQGDVLAIPEDGEWSVSRIERDQIPGWLSSLFRPELLP
jgi:TIGR03009 family protein